MQGPKSAVFTTVRARDGKLFHLEKHLARLTRHAEKLGIEIPDFEIPDGLEGLIKITITKQQYWQYFPSAKWSSAS